MKLIDNGIIRKLQADKDYKITDDKYSFFSDFIILGKNDIPNKYIEVPYEVWGSFLSNSAPKTKVEEYQETLSILKSDMKFLKKMGYELNCKLHLFIVNDVNKNESSIMTNNKSTGNVLNNIIEDSKNENNDDKFINLLRDTNLFKDNMVSNLKKAKKYYGSDVVSLLEKLYFNTVVDNKYMFKIYFSELFKKVK